MVHGLARARLGAGTVAGLLVVAALAAGCGDGSSPEASSAAVASTRPSASAAVATSPTAPADPSMSAVMSDPSATPADQIPGAQKSTFVLLNTRPAGLNGVTGTAWLAQNATTGTTLTVAATGLAPGGKYIAHLHAEPCSVKNGGGHFMFDPNGPAAPPNEVHLALPADSAGAVRATVTNARPVGDAAKSVVIHPVGALDKRVACADL
ncbi:superoxide dismutase family protein [Frankia sp. R82]|uniref:superoxide dismutase family protein n=1 Tax=Frankia sp. R82 TaxID=2950553 RepID=UPI0020434305|nr:superoxide dismutase family protein [Frankia sp. R82]MCM3886872.1 superoxide dismutase family protein [Frankia sp. R82]